MDLQLRRSPASQPVFSAGPDSFVDDAKTSTQSGALALRGGQAMGPGGTSSLRSEWSRLGGELEVRRL